MDIAPGARFGSWTVLSAERLRHSTCVACECDCGQRKEVQVQHLRGGRSTSCGCQKSRKLSEASRNYWSSVGRTYDQVIDGRRMSVRQMAEQYGMAEDTLRHRLNRGWPIRQALGLEPRERPHA